MYEILLTGWCNRVGTELGCKVGRWDQEMGQVLLFCGNRVGRGQNLRSGTMTEINSCVHTSLS